MNKFETIVCKLLSELGYEGVQKKILTNEIELLMFINNNTKLTQYYIITLCEKNVFKKTDFEQMQMNIYTILLEQNKKEPSIEKNTSWLIGIKCEDGYGDLMEKILNIEENPYYFKKMVLPYGDEEVVGLMNESNNCEQLILFLQQEILKVNRFEAFYEKKDKVYDFISKLFIKIPSIELLISKEKQLLNLSSVIQEEIKREELLDIYDVIKRDFTEKEILNDEDINKLCEVLYGGGSDDE